MEKIIFEIKSQIYDTIVLLKDYLKHIPLTSLIASIVLLYVIFLRKWTLNKILSFFFVIFLLLVLLVRLEAFLLAMLDHEGSQIGIGIIHILFFIAASVTFLYHAAVKD